MAVQFHYDEQIRRFLLQFTRMFSHYQVEHGRTTNGENPTYQTVPIKYGDPSRQAQYVVQENSANKIPSAPLLSFYVTALEYARARVQEPYFTDKTYIRQRKYDEVAKTYETTQGNAFTIERIMPVPYDLSISLDIWTTNTNQKLQLLEQILPLFNPSFEIQSTDNYLDWTSLSAVELTNVNWSSRSIPRGTDEALDIATLQFLLPIWLSSPAKVTKGGVIHQIIASIYDVDGNYSNPIQQDDLLLGTRIVITPHSYQLLLIGNQLQILKYNAIEDPKTNSFGELSSQESNILWHEVTHEYNGFKNGISQIRLKNKITDTEIVGTITYHPADDKIMLYTIDSDTLPQNTIPAVDAVINPLRSGPGVTTGKTTFPTPASGQRYLLTEGTGNENNNNIATSWSGTSNTQLVANINDIIEYDGSKWNVVFNASDTSGHEYVTNVTTNLQYIWTGEEWLRSYEGLYTGGEWSIVL